MPVWQFAAWFVLICRASRLVTYPAVSLWLNDSINRHGAIGAQLVRGINHSAGDLMQGLRRDVDGATVSVHRGT